MHSGQQIFRKQLGRVVFGVVHQRDVAALLCLLVSLKVFKHRSNGRGQVVHIQIFARQDLGVITVQVGPVYDVIVQTEQPVAQVERASLPHVGVKILLEQFFHRNRAALLAAHSTTSKDVGHQCALVVGFDSLAEVARTQVNPIGKDQAAIVVPFTAGAVTQLLNLLRRQFIALACEDVSELSEHGGVGLVLLKPAD